MLIFITGPLGSGKTTLTNILIKEYGFTEIYFAEPLKKFAIDIGFTEEQIYGTQEQKLEINSIYKISGREFMQKFATDVCRDFMPTIMPTMRSLWVKAAEAKVLSLIKLSKNIAISDGRFIDEAEMAKKYGAIIIKIIRDDKKSSHRSESELFKIKEDYLINNLGTIDDLKKQLLAILSSFK
jgi:hypothetical protein